ncbi:MAG: hypothetical protein IBX55_17955 [Methyloprofundus sp.]|nr:hypothetical protein [Methyloprofundus sp.]
MNYEWIIALAAGVLAGAFGGLVAPLLIERFRSSLVIRQEEIKNQLKKSEFFFENQYLAAKEFSAFFYALVPQKQHFADEWDEAMGHLATDLPDYGVYLSRFLEKYDVLLSEETIKSISNAISIVTDYIDEETSVSEIPENYPKFLEQDAPKFGGQFYKAAELAHKAIREVIRKQIK